MGARKPKSELRMRVFAGPNGSGKSTIINAVRKYKVKDIPLDFGIYVNADDILQNLLKSKFKFSDYQIETNDKEFQSVVLKSGLINKDFPESKFNNSYKFTKNSIRLKDLKDKNANEHIAQFIADFLREKLLSERKKFSFETVFSHESKLDIMQRAKDAGYKVYLYFVSTETPEINIDRVGIRVKKGEHNVPPDKITKRYYRSHNLLYDAVKLSYQSIFFDNSKTGEDFKLFAQLKTIKGKKNWIRYDEDLFPEWFIKYYLKKSN